MLFVPPEAPFHQQADAGGRASRSIPLKPKLFLPAEKLARSQFGDRVLLGIRHRRVDCPEAAHQDIVVANEPTLFGHELDAGRSPSHDAGGP